MGSCNCTNPGANAKDTEIILESLKGPSVKSTQTKKHQKEGAPPEPEDAGVPESENNKEDEIETKYISNDPQVINTVGKNTRVKLDAIEIENIGIYKGEWKNGKRDGYGVLT